MKRVFWALAILYAFTSVVSAQSLVEVAKKEKDRRKKVESQSKHAFTENDLRGGIRTPPAPPSSPGDTSADGATEEESAAAETPTEQDPAATESYWRDRVTAIDTRIRDLEAKLQSPELTANTRGAPQRQAAERDLAAARSERQALADEARRKGVPPGWLR
ncbi:MAG: hypothetical protein ACRD21_11035 [Vicinamibacteria bacterium]